MVAVRLTANGGGWGRGEVGVIARITILVVVMIMVVILLIVVVIVVVIMVVGGGSRRSDSSAIYGSRLRDMALTVYQRSKSAFRSYRVTTFRMHMR